MKLFRRFVMVLAALAAAAALHALAEEQGAPPPQSGKSEQPKQANPTVEAVEKLARRSDLIVLGDVTAVHDGTALDAGMSYDVTVDEVIKGEHAKGTLHFRSAGWVGYARYSKGEKVLLFLHYWGGSKPPELLQLQPITYVAEEEQPERGLRLWPLEPYLSLLRSNSAGGGRPASLPMGREPTAERPIVSDWGVPGSYALFGGKDGTKRIRIKWPEGLTDVRISRGGQCAAALIADRNVAEPYVVLYDVEGERVATVRLPREQPQRVSIRNLWLGDRQEAVVYMAGLTRETRPGDPPINPQVYYVNAKGVAELLPVPRTEEVLEVHFPATPGFALLAKEVKGDFRLQRYESPKRLVWEKTFPQDIPIPHFRPPRADGDIAVDAKGVREYRADGTEIAGGSSE
jgi:hypothetical protein